MREALSDGPMQGRLLIHLYLDHGVTESDVLSVVAVVIAAIGVCRDRRAH